MAYEKIGWKNHIVTNPRTYTVTDNPDGTKTLTPEPGTILQEGTSVNAENLNKMDNEIYNLDNTMGDDELDEQFESVSEGINALARPEYTEPEEDQELVSGETFKKAFGKISRAVSNLITHLTADNPHGITTDKIGAMNKTDPTGTGSFSLNRKAGTTVGKFSTAEGTSTTASGLASHSEGGSSEATGLFSHAEGNYTIASGANSHSEGSNNTASGYASHVEGEVNTASGKEAHAEGYRTVASGDYSHAEGNLTKASSVSQHVQGKCNIEDSDNKYANIVGNGSADTSRSNAHTLDWSGNAEFQGDVKANACGGENPISLVDLNTTVGTINDNLSNYTVTIKEAPANFNNANSTGTYYVGNTSSYTNVPVTGTSGILNVYGGVNNTRLMQEFIGAYGALFSRFFDGSTWTDWVELAPQSEVDKLNMFYGQYYYNGGSSSSITTTFKMDGHCTGLLIIAQNNYTDCYLIGGVSGITTLAKTSSTPTPTLDYSTKTLSVYIAAYGNATLLEFGR